MRPRERSTTSTDTASTGTQPNWLNGAAPRSLWLRCAGPQPKITTFTCCGEAPSGRPQQAAVVLQDAPIHHNGESGRRGPPRCALMHNRFLHPDDLGALADGGLEDF